MSDGVSWWTPWTGQEVTADPWLLSSGQKRPADPLNLPSDYLSKRFRYDQSCDSNYEGVDYWSRNSHIEQCNPLHVSMPDNGYSLMPYVLCNTPYVPQNLYMPDNEYSLMPYVLCNIPYVPQTLYHQYNQMVGLPAPGYAAYNVYNINMLPPHQLGNLHHPDPQNKLYPQNQPGPLHDKSNQPSPPYQLNKENLPIPPYQQGHLGKQNQSVPSYQQDSPQQLGLQTQPGPPNQQGPQLQLNNQNQPDTPYHQDSPQQLGIHNQSSLPHQLGKQNQLITPHQLEKQNQQSPPYQQGLPHQLGQQNHPGPSYQRETPSQLGKQTQPGQPYQQEPPMELNQSHQSPHHQEIPNPFTQNIPIQKHSQEPTITTPNIAGLLLNDAVLNGFKRAIDRIVREIKPRIVDLTSDEVVSSLRQEVRERIFQALMSQSVTSINQFEIYWMYRNVHDSNSDTELLYRLCGIKYITTTPECDSKGCEIFKGPGSVSQASLTRIEEAISTIFEFHLKYLESIIKPSVGKQKSLKFLVRDRMYNIIMNRPVGDYYELLNAYTDCHSISDCDHEVLNDYFPGKSQIPCANINTHPLSHTIDSRSSADRLNIFHGPKSASEQTLVLITRAALLLLTFQHIKEDGQRYILIEHFMKLTEVQQMGFQREILDRLYKHFTGSLVPSENDMCELYRRCHNYNEDYKLILYIQNSPQFKRSRVFADLSALSEAIIEIKKSMCDSDLEKIQAVEDKIIKELTDINLTIVAFHIITVKLLVRYRIYKICKGKPVSPDLYQLYRRDHNVKSDENLLSFVLRGKTNWNHADGGDKGTKDLQLPPEPVGDCLTVDTRQDPTNQMVTSHITSTSVPRLECFQVEIFHGPKTASKIVLLKIHAAAKKIVNDMKIDSHMIANKKSVVQSRFYKLLMGLKVPTFKELLNMYQTHYSLENYHSGCEAENKEMEDSQTCCTREFSKCLTHNKSSVTEHIVSGITVKTNPMVSNGTINKELITTNETGYTKLIEPCKTSNIEIVLPHLNTNLMESDETVKTNLIPITNAMELISSPKTNDTTLMDLDGTRTKGPKAADKTNKTNPIEQCNETKIKPMPKENVVPIFLGPKTAEKTTLMRINEAADRIIGNMEIDHSQIPQTKSAVLDRFYEMLAGFPVPSCQNLLTAYESRYDFKNKIKLEISRNEASKPNPSSDQSASNLPKTSEMTNTDPKENNQPNSSTTNPTSLTRKDLIRCYYESDSASVLRNVEFAIDKILGRLKKNYHLIEYQTVLATLEIRRCLYEICKRFSCLPTVKCLIYEYKVHYDMNNDNRLLEILNQVSNPRASVQNGDTFDVPKSLTYTHLKAINEAVVRVMNQLKIKGFPQILLASSIVYRRIYKIFVNMHLSCKKQIIKSTVSIYTAHYGVVPENDKRLCEILKKKSDSDALTEMVTCSEIASALPKESIKMCHRSLLTPADAVISGNNKDDLHNLRLPNELLQTQIIANMGLDSYEVIKATFAILHGMHIHLSGISNFDLTFMQWIVRDRMREIFKSKNNMPCVRELFSFYKDNHTTESDTKLLRYIQLRTHSKKFATTYLQNAPTLILTDSLNTSDMKIIEKEEKKVMGYVKNNHALSSQFYELFVKWVVRYRIYKIIKADPSAINQNLHMRYRHLYRKESNETLLQNLSTGNIQKNQTQEEGNRFASSVQQTSEPIVNINEDQITLKVSKLVKKVLNLLFSENSQVYLNQNLNHSTDVSNHERTESELIEERVHKAMWKNLHDILLSVENDVSSKIATNEQLCISMEPEPPENTIKCSSCQLVKLSGEPKLPSLQELQQFLEKYKPTSYQMYTEVKNTIFLEIPHENDIHELKQMKDISIGGNSITITSIPYSYLDVLTKNKERNPTGEQCRIETNNIRDAQTEYNINVTLTCENGDECNKDTETHCDYTIRNDTVPNKSPLQNSIHTEKHCVTTITNENGDQYSMEAEKYFNVTITDKNREEFRKQTESHYDDSVINENGSEFGTKKVNSCVTAKRNKSADQCTMETENNFDATRTNENRYTCSMETENNCETIVINESRAKCITHAENKCVNTVTNESADQCSTKTENNCDATTSNEYRDQYIKHTENHYDAMATNDNGDECKMETKKLHDAAKTKDDVNKHSMETENDRVAKVTNANEGECGTNNKNICLSTIRNERTDQRTTETESNWFAKMANENVDKFIKQPKHNYKATGTKDNEYKCRIENNCVATITNEGANQSSIEIENHCDATNNNGDECTTYTASNCVTMIPNECADQCCMETGKDCYVKTFTNENEDQCVNGPEIHCDNIVSNDNEDICTQGTENNCVAAKTNDIADQCTNETKNHHYATRSNENGDQYMRQPANHYDATAANEIGDECRTKTEISKESGHQYDTENDSDLDTMTTEHADELIMETENHCNRTITNENLDEYKDNENYKATIMNKECKIAMENCVATIISTGQFQRSLKTENHTVTSITSEVTNHEIDQCRIKTEDMCVDTITNENYLGERDSLDKIMDELDDQLNDLFTSLMESEDIVETESA